MKPIKITPNDVLFLKDGRPMTASNVGHGDAWPSATAFNAALHLSLYRISAKHQTHNVNGKSMFGGDLQSIGLFPLHNESIPYFPTPLDIIIKNDAEKQNRTVRFLPMKNNEGNSSLKSGLSLCMPLTLTDITKKDRTPTWISFDEYNEYAKSSDSIEIEGKDNEYFFSSEYSVGIAIDPETKVAQDTQFYSKAQLRLKQNCSMLGFINFADTKKTHFDTTKYLEQVKYINLGGENRISQIEALSSDVTLPRGIRCDAVTSTLIKFVLLTPAVFPATKLDNKVIHSGGWLPNWISPDSYKVNLLDGPGEAKAKRLHLPVGKPINARLVSAIIGKKQDIVSGWSTGSNGKNVGSKSTLLAVPAGSVYFFEADTVEDAKKLVSILSWDSGVNTNRIVNRRSLFGEKGFGVGICAQWDWNKNEI